GKTTLTSLVPRFYDVLSGRITVDGVDVRDVTLTSLRRDIGVIAQAPFLFSASVRENIAFGRGDLSGEEIERAARAAQAHEFIERLPNGYDTVIGERGITLSGGQRQRIAIARALAVDPRILILDDATASVDASTEARIRAGLREAMRERAADVEDWSWRKTRARLGLLWGLTAPYRGRVALSTVSLLLATVTALAPPYLAKFALDDAIEGHGGTQLVLVVVLFVAAGL